MWSSDRAPCVVAVTSAPATGRESAQLNSARGSGSSSKPACASRARCCGTFADMLWPASGWQAAELWRGDHALCMVDLTIAHVCPCTGRTAVRLDGTGGGSNCALVGLSNGMTQAQGGNLDVCSCTRIGCRRLRDSCQTKSRRQPAEEPKLSPSLSPDVCPRLQGLHHCNQQCQGF